MSDDLTAGSNNQYHITKATIGQSGVDTRAQTDQQVTEAGRKFSSHAAEGIHEEVTSADAHNVAYQEAIHKQQLSEAQGQSLRPAATFSGIDYSQHTHAELAEFVQTDANTAAVGALGEDVHKAAVDLANIQNTVKKSIDDSEALWNGESAGVYRQAFANIGDQIGTTAQGIALVGTQIMAHSQSLNMTQAKVGTPPTTLITEDHLQQSQHTAVTSTNHADQVAYQKDLAQFQAQENERMIAVDALHTLDNTYGGATVFPNFTKVSETAKPGGGPSTTAGPHSGGGHVATAVVKNTGTTQKTSTTTAPEPVKEKSQPPITVTTPDPKPPTSTTPVNVPVSNPIAPIATTPVSTGNTGGTSVSSTPTASVPGSMAGLSSGYASNGAPIGSPAALGNYGQDAVRSNSQLTGNALPGSQDALSPYGRDGLGRTLDRTGNVAGRTPASFSGNRAADGRPLPSNSSANGQNGMPGGAGQGKKGEKDREHHSKYPITGPLIKTPEAPTDYDEWFPIEAAIHRCGYRDFGKQGLSIEMQRELRRERGWSNADADDADFMWFKPLTGTWRDFNW